MSYLVLARKYRPLDFDSVSGQEHVTRTLANAIKRDKVAHAFLFAGPRGVGKTSVARILGKALNCKDGPTTKPCLKCSNCLEISSGNSLAVREIDGASHNGVDNVRELIESFRALPPPGSKYKIYIIDEVHMLTTAAFNALLKSLEEPPPHTIFILATTEAHKIPETVISRCQRHDFRALGNDIIEARLKQIALSEKLKVENEALRMIARLSEGSMRDAQSLLDRVQSFCEGEITAEETGKVLGTVERAALFKISQAIISRDPGLAIELVDAAFSTGLDIGLFLKEFVTHFRDLLLAKLGGQGALTKLGLGQDESVELIRQVQALSSNDIQDLMHLVREGADSAIRSAYPRYTLEALVVRLATREPVKEIGQLLNQVKRIVSGGLSVPSRESGAGTAQRSQPVSARAAGVVTEARTEPSVGAAKHGPAKTLDWNSFVMIVSQGSNKMLAEQLKRLSVEEFSPGSLKVGGPEFSIAYFQKKENHDKLLELLEEKVGEKNWRLKLNISHAGATASQGSITHKETEEQNRKQSERQASIENHPSLKSLQKVFPGSKIEKTVAKDS